MDRSSRPRSGPWLAPPLPMPRPGDHLHPTRRRHRQHIVATLHQHTEPTTLSVLTITWPRKVGRDDACAGASSELDLAQKLTGAHHQEADLVFGEPVFTPQAIYATELPNIAGDDREATASSVAGDQQIVTADGQSPALQARSDVSGVVSGGVIERQHFEPSGEALHLISILFRSRGFSRAVEKFGEDYRGGAKAVSFEIKPLPYLPRPVSQHPDAKVRVEQEAKHQNTSRPWTWGCFRSPRSTPGESKKSSQIASDGTMTLRFPSRRIATERTPSGNATSFGSRTACERFDWNSVVRFMRSPWDIHNVYPTTRVFKSIEGEGRSPRIRRAPCP
jgi:hypothetical protein